MTKGLESSINLRKHELKQLEQIQRKKDMIIEDLEIQAGKDKKVIKEVIVDKIRDSKVDDVMEDLIVKCRVPIKKISENYFEFGSKKIYVRPDPKTGEIMVRDKGGRYVELYQFIRDNEENEYLRLVDMNTIANANLNKKTVQVATIRLDLGSQINGKNQNQIYQD